MVVGHCWACIGKILLAFVAIKVVGDYVNRALGRMLLLRGKEDLAGGQRHVVAIKMHLWSSSTSSGYRILASNKFSRTFKGQAKDVNSVELIICRNTTNWNTCFFSK